MPEWCSSTYFPVSSWQRRSLKRGLRLRRWTGEQLRVVLLVRAPRSIQKFQPWSIYVRGHGKRDLYGWNVKSKFLWFKFLGVKKPQKLNFHIPALYKVFSHAPITL